ncbi:uncharacterized protein LOC143585649 [Bidens hawaiensis]|uniref:uncharacterized protein LOC143585649 n=1 Tax=Bidens hawaiensis TaxID=980011 RepID=UPI00404A2A31
MLLHLLTLNMLTADGNLHVTKFGVRFIRKEQIRCVKHYYIESVYEHRSSYYRFYVDACEDDTNLDHCAHKIIDFVSKNRSTVLLDGIYQITKCLLESNQEFFSVLSKYREWKYKEYVYCYYVISLGVSVLYKDFVRSLKDMNDGWLSVKLALEQIMVKSRADNYSFEEMKQHLNDLKAAQNVHFSDKFIRMFLSICGRTFDILNYMETEFPYESKYQLENISPKKKIKRMKVLAKKTSITIAGVFCMMASYLGDSRDNCLTSILEHMLAGFHSKNEYLENGRFKMNAYLTLILEPLLAGFHSKNQYFVEDGRFKMNTFDNDKSELQISEFRYNKFLLQVLMDTVGRSSCFTKLNGEEMVSVIDKLQNNIHKVSQTIKKMSSHANKYAHALRKARKHIKSFSRLSKDDDIISMLPLFN